ncbi:MAG TPA: bifunctional 3-phenylpropionate/cinnamic acid dioxygenase ferredoxin subunit [Chloroflexota bacterium]|nr:bifunctional 3-phenylpropionate/cinnamic acid dioxygenase ferredoxin subunit [Chloroflexota bacterium]
MVWVPVCKTADVSSGDAACIKLDDRFLAIYNVDGEFFASDDSCTHEEASLAEGFLEDHLIECPLHGSQFDVRSGEVLSLPAVRPLRTYPVRLEGDDVLVELDR